MYAENSNLRGSTIVQLTRGLTDLDLTRQVKLLFIKISEQAESKQISPMVSVL